MDVKFLKKWVRRRQIFVSHAVFVTQGESASGGRKGKAHVAKVIGAHFTLLRRLSARGATAPETFVAAGTRNRREAPYALTKPN